MVELFYCQILFPRRSLLNRGLSETTPLLMLSPLDEAVGYDGRPLAFPKIGVNRLDTSVASLQKFKFAPSHQSTNGGGQDCQDCQGPRPPDPVIPVTQPVYYQHPLTPNSPSWARQRTPPWPTAAADANGSVLPSPTCGVDVAGPSLAELVSLPNSTMIYNPSRPDHLDLSAAQCVPIHSALHPQSPNSPPASYSQTGLVSPPCSLIGQPPITIPPGPDRRREPEALAPASPSKPAVPARPRKQVRFKESTPSNEAETEKEKNRAYHREVGARNRLKEKQEKAHYESERQFLENLNTQLIAEEKQLATEKQSLFDELYRHSLCNHNDVDKFLILESQKMQVSFLYMTTGPRKRFGEENNDGGLHGGGSTSCRRPCHLCVVLTVRV